VSFLLSRRGWFGALGVGACMMSLSATAELVLPGGDRAPDTQVEPAPEEFLRLPERQEKAPAPAPAPEAPPAAPLPEGREADETVHRNLSPPSGEPRSITGVHEHESDAWEGEWLTTLDLFNDAVGGVETGFEAVGLVEFFGGVRGDDFGWDGGRLGVHLAYALGESPSRRVGDVSGVSGIDAGGATGFFIWDAWVQQELPWWGTRLRAGVVDFNNDFYVADYANLFLNGSFGMGVEVGGGGGTVPTYPATGPGLEAFFTPFGTGYLNLGAWKGVPDTEGVLRNGDGGWFYVAEGGMVKGTSGAPGYLKLGLGYWLDTNTLDHWAGDDWQAAGRSGAAFAGAPRVGNSGYYLLAEAGVGHRLGLFFKAGRADPARNRYAATYAVGFQANALLPGRPDDALGVGLVRTEHSADFLDYALGEGVRYFRAENAYEITYSARVGRHWLVQPDFQYVIQPGMDLRVANALVLGLRLQGLW